CLGRVDHDPLLDAMLEETPRRVLDGLEDEPTFAAKLEARRSTGLDLVDDQVVRVRKRWSDDAAKAVGVLAHDIDRGEDPRISSAREHASGLRPVVRVVRVEGVEEEKVAEREDAARELVDLEVLGSEERVRAAMMEEGA